MASGSDLNHPESRVLMAVRSAGEEMRALGCGRWVTVYDVSDALQRDIGRQPYTDPRYLGTSMLPTMAREGLLATLRRTGCSVMYEPSPKGWAALRRLRALVGS